MLPYWKKTLGRWFLRNVHWPLSSCGMSSEQRSYPPFPKTMAKKKEDGFNGEGGARVGGSWGRSNYTKEIQQANVQREEVRHVFEKHFLVELWGNVRNGIAGDEPIFLLVLRPCAYMCVKSKVMCATSDECVDGEMHLLLCVFLVLRRRSIW